MAIKRDLYQSVTDKIVTELEKGCAPWVRPWNVKGKHAAPYNATTGKRYRGINHLLLGLLPNFDVPSFLTFNQCRDVGGMVRKGEHGHKIYFFKPWTIRDTATGEEKKIPLLKEFTVFNVTQCEKLPTEFYGSPVSPVQHPDKINPDFAAYVSASGATVNHGGDRAFYATAGDFVQMPQVAAFQTVAHYEATLAHELVHWSGHESRLNRDLRNRFGTKAYAAEELIAEMGAAFTCATFGITGDLRHAGYIKTWIELLKDDSRAIFTAASKAQQAVDYLTSKQAAQDEAQDDLAIAA